MPDLGNLFLYITLCVSLFIALAPVIESCGVKISYLTLKLLWLFVLFFAVLALICLIYCYVVSDFSVLNVVQNSHLLKPLIYKISGSWSSHEGSMLLWISAISVFAIICAFLITNESLGKLTLSVQATLNSFFIAFTIFASNPFWRIFPAASSGAGLNPILQDIGLALHPPILYLGYIGFSAGYSVTIAALITRQIDKEWAELVKIFTMVSWFFLTIGIALGSWWAYRELGWGGFWFWDPVENSSLMPWLSATALVHALNTYRKTYHMRQWSIALALLTFTLSILGMFLVRSGIVTSVHAFAIDSRKGVMIFGFLVALICSSLWIFLRWIAFQPQRSPSRMRLGIFFLNMNNLLFATAIFVVATGTLYPTILELTTGHSISVGAPYFHQVFSPIALLLAALCAIGSGLKWDKTSTFNKNFAVLSAAALCAAALCTHIGLSHFIDIAGVILGFTLIASCGLYAFCTKDRPKSKFYSAILGHLGFAIIVIAIAINAGLQVDIEKAIKTGETVDFLDYKVSLVNVLYEKRSNHIAQIAIVRLENKSTKTFLKPEVRFFPIEAQQTIEAAIHKEFLRDIYITTDRVYGANGTVLRIFSNPMMGWLWFGGSLLALAALYSVIQNLQRYYQKPKKSNANHTL